MMPQFEPFTFDPLLADMDRALLGADAWVYLRWMTDYESVVRALYGPLWLAFATTGTFLVCISDWDRRSQYIWTFLICWVLLGNIIPLSFMAAGPVFYEGITGSRRFFELSNFIFAQARTGLPDAQLPSILWDSYIHQRPGLGLGISAFPSIHVAMATLYALAGFALHCSVGYVMVGYLL